MAFLLDTHTFLWFVLGNNQMPIVLRSKIQNIKQICFLRVASLWEITIKQHLGKLELNISLQELFECIEKNQIEIVSINYNHLLALSKLPNHHNDPFDRLIVAQAIAEDLVLISKDKVLKKYKVKHQWK